MIDLFNDLSESDSYEILDLLAGRGITVTELQQRADVRQGESRRLCRSHEPKPVQCLLTVDAIVAFAATVRLEQATPFVIPDRRGRHPSLLRQGANCESLPHRHTPLEGITTLNHSSMFAVSLQNYQWQSRSTLWAPGGQAVSSATVLVPSIVRHVGQEPTPQRKLLTMAAGGQFSTHAVDASPPLSLDAPSDDEAFLCIERQRVQPVGGVRAWWAQATRQETVPVRVVPVPSRRGRT